jgi:Ca2+-transporting ATPase
LEIKYPIENASSLSIDEVVLAMQTDIELGISKAEAFKRGIEFGLNAQQTQPIKSKWAMLLSQFKSPIVYLLFIAAGASLYFQQTIEAVAILIVIVVNAMIGFFMELQARSSMRALRKMDISMAKVTHGGKLKEIPSQNLVPGDLVSIEAGDLFAADGRLVVCNQLSCDESSLTGESFPVTKSIAAITDHTAITDSVNMVFKGTAVLNGNGKFVVTAIGSATELGKITKLVANSLSTATPLDKKISNLTRNLIWITLAMTAIFALSGILQGRSWLLILETSIALAVAAFPEGLPIVATVALAYGMLLMAKKNAIVKKLSAVETLGGVNVILTDKTGTLTENKIYVEQFSFPDEEIDVTIKKGNLVYADGAILKSTANFEKITLIGVLCNNSPIEQIDGDKKLIGDPVEVALVTLAISAKLNLLATHKLYKRLSEVPFSSETKLMGTVHQHKKSYFIAAKGAVENLILKCTHQQNGDKIEEITKAHLKSILAKSEKMAANGLRVLAFAYRETQNKPKENYLKELIFVGMIGFLDPPRLDIKPAILACQTAGIKIVMITGDHPLTALNIAKRVGIIIDENKAVLTGKELPEITAVSKKWEKKILSTAVFARTTPQQKLEIVSIYQKAGLIVAMTGDGVNDAPALKKADIGIAMGIRGTQVAKETANIVLKDDSFISIAAAVAHGREIFQNIQRFVIYLVSCNLSEIFIVTLLGFVASESIMLPMQILFLNMVTDVFPALALGLGVGDKTVMLKPPRNPKLEILKLGNWVSIFIYAMLITVSVLAAVFYCKYYIGTSPKLLNNIAFITLAFSQLFHVFNMSSRHSSLLVNEITKNKYVWMALLLCAVLVLAVYAFEASRVALGLTILPLKIWLVSLLASLLPLVIVQFYKVINNQINHSNK